MKITNPDHLKLVENFRANKKDEADEKAKEVSELIHKRHELETNYYEALESCVTQEEFDAMAAITVEFIALKHFLLAEEHKLRGCYDKNKALKAMEDEAEDLEDRLNARYIIMQYKGKDD